MAASYSRRPLWQWILIYIVVGGILYFIIYYFVLGHNGGSYSYGSSTQPTSSQPTSY